MSVDEDMFALPAGDDGDNDDDDIFTRPSGLFTSRTSNLFSDIDQVTQVRWNVYISSAAIDWNTEMLLR